MFDKGTGDKPGRRPAVMLIGGLAAGAALSAALGASALAAEQDASISEQFRNAFTPGAARLVAAPGEPIVVTVV